MTQILVVGPSWVGDMVMAQSLFKVLRDKDPTCDIDVLAPAWSLPLLERMPEVRRGIKMPLGHGKLDLKTRYQLGCSLRSQGYQQAILLPNSLKSALVPFWAKIPLRTGWLGEFRYGLLNDHRKLDKSRFTMTVQRFVALADECPEYPRDTIPAPELIVDESNVANALQEFGLNTNKPVLSICPGAEYGPAKRWPEQYCAELADRYSEKGFQVWLFGSEKDQAVTADIQHYAKHQLIDLAGKTSLGQAIDLMSLSKVVVSNDSGLMHMAAALNCALVAIYGSSDPHFTPPLNENHRIVSLALDCSPCFKRECPLGHLDCLNKLSVDLVDAAIDELLS